MTGRYEYLMNLIVFERLNPKNPFVCPKKGIGPPTFLFVSDGIGTQKILFDRDGSGFLGYSYISDPIFHSIKSNQI